MSEVIKVRSGLADPRRVALWERDERHPDEEVFITGRRGETAVYKTAEVHHRLRNGTLVQVEEETAGRSTAVSSIDGIGVTTEKKLNAAGVFTVADLLALDGDELARVSDETELSVDRLKGWQEAA